MSLFELEFRTNINNIAISNHTSLKLFVQTFRIYLKLIYKYELDTLLKIQNLVPQRIEEKLHEGHTASGPPSFGKSSTEP